MQKRVLYKNLELGVINLGGLLKELRGKEFTGYIKNRGWDYEDYIAFWEGKPVHAISIKENGEKEELKLGDYIWIERGKTIDVVETDPLSLANIFRESYSVEDSRALIIAGVGDEITEPIKFSLFNMENALASLERGHFTGYIAWTNPVEVVGMCLLYNGSPIALNSGRLWDMEAQPLIVSKLGSETYVHMYSIEPEIVLMVNSTRLGLRKETFFSLEEVEAGIYEEVHGNGGSYSFIYRGQQVFGFKLSSGEVEPFSFKAKGSASVWSVDIINTPSKIELSLNTKSVEMLSQDAIMGIKEVFVDEIGPVGPILWDRILSELGVDNNSIPKDMAEKLLNKLASEIPEESHAEAFLSRVRRFVK